MNRCRAAVLLVSLLWLLLASITTHAQGDSPSEIIRQVNELRAARGLAALQMDASLMAAAQGHASWMAATHTRGHAGEGGTSPQQRANAAGYSGWAMENYVGGTNLTAREGINWWINSPIHLNTMLASDYVHVGAGVGVDGDTVLYVLVVGKPRAVEPAAGSGSTSAEEEEEEATAGPIVVPISLSPPREDGSIVHVVQEGQTAWALAARYGVDLGEMLWINNLPQGAVLHPGDEVIIKLGPGQAPPPTPTLPTTHIVQEGQTAWDVAALYGLTLDQLLELNGIERGVVLFPGDQLLIRQPDPTATPTPLPTNTALPATVTPSPPPVTQAVAQVVTTQPPTITLTPTATLSPTSTPPPALAHVDHSQDEAFEAAAFVGVIVVVLALAASIGGAVVLRRWQS